MAYPPGAGGPPGGYGGPPAGPPGGYGPPAGPPGGYGGPPRGGPPGGFGGPPGGFGGPPGGGPPGGFGGPPGGFGGPPGGGPPGGGFGGGFRHGAPPDPAKEAKEKAKLGMILALIGVPLCCFPLAMVGGFMGYSAMGKAKAKGVATPGTAYVAMIAAVLSTLLAATVGIFAYQDYAAKQEQLAGVADKLKGKRTEKELKKKIACLLAEERLLADGFEGTSLAPEDVSCKSAELKVDGRTAELTGLRFKMGSEEHKATTCLARGARWFVMKMTGDSACGTIYPPDEADADGKSEERLKKMEDEARDEQEEKEVEALVAVYKKTLVTIRKDAAEPPNGALAKCSDDAISERLGSRKEVKIKTVDFDLLNKAEGSNDKNWDFITSSEVRGILKEGNAKQKLADVNALKKAGNLILVYRAKTKLWPVVTMKNSFSDDFSFDGGAFAGWMLVYDLRTGQRLCHSELIAQNSESVKYRKGRFSSKRAKAEKAVFEDLRDNFKDAATDNIKKLSPKLKLGYKFLE